MEFSAKEALGFVIALICTAMVIGALVNFGALNYIASFLTACDQNKTVEVTYPSSGHSLETENNKVSNEETKNDEKNNNGPENDKINETSNNNN